MNATPVPQIRVLSPMEESFIYKSFLYGTRDKKDFLSAEVADTLTLEECIMDFGIQKYCLMATKHKQFRNLRRLWALLFPSDTVFPSWLPVTGEPVDKHWHEFCQSVAACALTNHDSTMWFFLAPKNW